MLRPSEQNGIDELREMLEEMDYVRYYREIRKEWYNKDPWADFVQRPSDSSSTR